MCIYIYIYIININFVCHVQKCQYIYNIYNIYIYHIYMYIYIYNKKQDIYFLTSYFFEIISSKVWKKPKYNSLKNICLVFDISNYHF